MAMALGLQLYSVREAFAHDATETLEQVAAIGYKNLEVVMRVANGEASLGGDLSPAHFRQQLDRLGMAAVSCHTRVSADTDWPRILAANRTIGSTSVGCSIAFFTDKADVLRFCAMFNAAARTCHDAGIQLYYHNHFQEYQVFEGSMVIDLLLENTDPSLVKFEFDTYWAARGGADPVAWMRKLGSRCDLIHQKDRPATARPVNWFDAFGAGSTITLDNLIKTQGTDQFTEVGEGEMDIAAIVRVARELGFARYIFVEQDVSGRGELESIGISYNALSRILAAN